MNQIARILFLIVACIFPIFIGVLHTATHFTDLVTPEINQYLQKEVIILGTKQPLWNTWGIVSFMMGASFIVIGLLNSSILKRTAKTISLPILAIVAMLIYQICVTYVGYQFEQGFQFYGGIFGLTLIVICLILSIKHKNNMLK